MKELSRDEWLSDLKIIVRDYHKAKDKLFELMGIGDDFINQEELVDSINSTIIQTVTHYLEVFDV